MNTSSSLNGLSGLQALDQYQQGLSGYFPQASQQNMYMRQGFPPTDAEIAAMQRAALRNFVSLHSIRAQSPETKLGRAQRIAEEVRSRRPEMQVKRRTRSEA